MDWKDGKKMSMEVEAKDPPAASSAGGTSTGKHHAVFSVIPDNLRKLDTTAPVITWEACGGDNAEFIAAWLAYGRGRGWEYFVEVNTQPLSASNASVPEMKPENLETVKKEYEDACRPDKAVDNKKRQLAREEYLRARLRLRGRSTNIPRFAAIIGGKETPEPPHVTMERAAAWTYLEKALRPWVGSPLLPRAYRALSAQTTMARSSLPSAARKRNAFFSP